MMCQLGGELVNWSLVIGQCSLVTGHWLLVEGDWERVGIQKEIVKNE